MLRFNSENDFFTEFASLEVNVLFVSVQTDFFVKLLQIENRYIQAKAQAFTFFSHRRYKGMV